MPGHHHAILVALALACGSPLTMRAQDRCIRDAEGYCVDLRLASAAFGYSSAGIGHLSSGKPDRVLQGLNLRFDVHILSLVLRHLPVATYDALYADATFGKMTSAPLSYAGVQESTGLGMPFTYGYSFLAGIRSSAVALLGGLGYEYWAHDIGGSTMKNSAMPFLARLELGRTKPIVVMGWYAGGARGVQGARIDVPLYRRLNLTAMYWRADGTTELITTPNNTVETATARMLMLGFRTAEIR